MRAKHKGTTIIELIIVLGIMALISMLIVTMLSSTVILNNKNSSTNDKEYKSHEFYRFLRSNIKKLIVSDVVIEENEISIIYTEGDNRSDMIEILQDNNKVVLRYYDKQSDGQYVRTGPQRDILKNTNNINFRVDGNLLYVKVLWEDGGISSGIIDL